MFKDCFYELRKFMYENFKDFGKDTGEDEKIFLSKAKGPNKDRNKEDDRCDMDANFTIKESFCKDPKTEESKSKKKHILVTCIIF